MVESYNTYMPIIEFTFCNVVELVSLSGQTQVSCGKKF